MIPEICLISVPHSGTNFLRNALVGRGWTDMTLYGRGPGGNKLYQGHCTKFGQTLQAIDLAKRMPLVMPLRHPYRVEESWKRRRYDEMSELWNAYDHMLEDLRERVDVFVPLDAVSAIRDKAHDRLNRLCGLELELDFSVPVASKHGTHNIALSALDPSWRIREIRSHTLFTEFYGHDDDHD